MTTPITPDPAVHTRKPQDTTPTESNQLQTWARNLFNAIVAQVLSALTFGLLNPKDVTNALNFVEDGIGGVVANIQNGLAGIGAAIGGAVQGVLDTWNHFWDGLNPDATRTGQIGANGFLSAVQSLGSQLSTAATNALSALSQLGAMIGNALANGAAQLGTLINSIGQNAQTALTNAASGLSQIGSMVSGAVTTTAANFGGLVKTVADGLRGGVQSIGDGLKGVLTPRSLDPWAGGTYDTFTIDWSGLQTIAGNFSNLTRAQITSGTNLVTDPLITNRMFWDNSGATVSSDYTHSGTPTPSSSKTKPAYSLKLTSQGATPVSLYFTPNDLADVQTIKCLPGDCFYVSCWVRGNSANSNSGVVTLFAEISDSTESKDSNGDLIYPTLTPSLNTVTIGTGLFSGWQQISKAYKIPTGYDQFTAGVKLAANDTTTGNRFYVDDLMLREESEAQAIKDGLYQAVYGGSSTLNDTTAMRTAVSAVNSTATAAQTQASTAYTTATGAAATANTAYTTATGASATANNAYVTATGAAATANNAYVTATGAQGTANTAYVTATGAAATANTAYVTATGASAAAATAQGTASSALAGATAAQNAATVAQGTASSALAGATAAQNAAAGAQTAATNAQGTASSALSLAQGATAANAATNQAIYNGYFGSGGTGSASEAQATIQAIKVKISSGYTLQTLTANTGSQVELVTISGGPTGGSFTLSAGGQTTGSLAYNVAASGGTGATGSVQNALAALSTIGTGNVTVTGSAGGPYTVTLPPRIQTITLNGIPTGGTFTITHNGQTTSALAYNASAATVQSALQALSTIGSGNVTVVTGTVSGATYYTLTFASTLAGYRVVTTNSSALTGGTSPSADVVVSYYMLSATSSLTGGTSPSVVAQPTWTPSWVSGSEPAEFYCIAFGSGGGGGKGSQALVSASSTWPGGNPGQPGGYAASQITAVSLTGTTVPYTVAAGGAGGTTTSATSGSETSFGSYVKTTYGLNYAQNLLGYYSSDNSAPAGGGTGGQVASISAASGTNGGSTILASGGLGGGAGSIFGTSTGSSGGSGGNAGLTGGTRAGGGGGGGGGGAYAGAGGAPYKAYGGNGGSGGFPGGGGGGGGSGIAYTASGSTATAGNGGVGGNGVIVLIWK